MKSLGPRLKYPRTGNQDNILIYMQEDNIVIIILFTSNYIAINSNK